MAPRDAYEGAAELELLAAFRTNPFAFIYGVKHFAEFLCNMLVSQISCRGGGNLEHLSGILIAKLPYSPTN